MFQNVIENILNVKWLNQVILLKIIFSGLIIFVLWLIHFLIQKIIWKKTDNIQTRYIWRKITNYSIVIFNALILGSIWITDFKQIGTFLGLLSAGIAISLKDLIINVAGWIFILTRRPFTIGDRIQIGENAGDVIDIRFFQFTLMEIGNWVDSDQSTGRIIHIPNGKIFTDPVANYNKGFEFIWNEIPVLVTFESNWQKAKTILQQVVLRNAEDLNSSAREKIKEASKRFMILYSNLTPFVYTSTKESGVLLSIRYLCKPRKRRDTEHAIWENILTEFSKCEDIDFAYPTQRFYNNQFEGKSKIKKSGKKHKT
ncbi:MAG: mechanosensitive ion channel protein MscS [Spirochaetes bacterium GWD1_27_9]|nr:MAG: mechanosensitive ion channel protein MscS [Spirochaetes bacterium GWB1_27_13]OHD28286.1 MAG: mechanosensitive ion channel protein MscS [Spirochaetes bacterium GWC1_27_15]OHD35053.1 MAG: mechanosensitive ion channel protein MscS [Spirochaetes bacterium GWD1_27_9]